MYNKYNIKLQKEQGITSYYCTQEDKLYYTVRFSICRCGAVYPEPIVIANSHYTISIFVEGISNTSNRLSYSSNIGEGSEESLAQVIADHSGGEIDRINHSLDRAKYIINTQYGGEYDIGRCAGETIFD